jgi:hypothetical protein
VAINPQHLADRISSRVAPELYGLDPHPAESLRGYLGRLGKNNFGEGRRIIRKYLEIAGNSGTLKGPQIAALSGLTGIAESKFRAMQHQDGDGENAFFGHPWGRQAIAYGQSKLCQECYRESEVHNRIFDIDFMTVCPKHRLPIIDTCHCGAALKWSRPTFEICPKGDLLPYTGQQAIAGERRLLAETLVFERCGYPIAGVSAQAALHPDIRDRSLLGQLSLFKLLGLLQDGDSERGNPGSSRNWHDDISGVLNAGFQMAVEWPQSLLGWLEQNYRPTRRGPSDLGEAIKVLQRSLSRDVLFDVKDVVAGVIGEFAQSKKVYGRRGAQWRSRKGASESLETLTEAATRMGVTFRKARKLAVERGWTSAGQWQHSNMITLNRTLVDEWILNMREELSLDAASRILKLDRQSMQEVIDLGLIGFRRRWRAEDGSAGQWRVEKGELFRFMRRVIYAVPARGRPGPSVSVREFRQSHHLQSFDLGISVKALLLGSLDATGWSEDLCLRDLRFDEAELLSLFSSAEAVEQVREARLGESKVMSGQHSARWTPRERVIMGVLGIKPPRRIAESTES